MHADRASRPGRFHKSLVRRSRQMQMDDLETGAITMIARVILNLPAVNEHSRFKREFTRRGEREASIKMRQRDCEGKYLRDNYVDKHRLRC
jgi:hypothetical protein